MDEFIKIAYSIQKTKAMINAILDYLKSGNVNPDGTVRKLYSAYTLDELTSMGLLGRVKISDWRMEIFTLTFTLLFVIFFKGGDWYNYSKVSAFLTGVKDVFEDNFAQFGIGNGKLYVKDSAESYSSYASGRENIEKVNISFKLAPRQNIFLWIMESGFSFFTDSVQAPKDKVEIVVTPSGDYENFISAIVSKLGMSDFRKFNYFLALTKTSDSEKLPESFVFMSEANEFHEKTFTDKFASTLNLGLASVVRFLAFTDQPNEKPEIVRHLAPQRRVILSLNLPTGKQELKEVSDLLAGIFDVIDQLSEKKITFRPEAVKKVVKNRELEIQKLLKIEEELKKEAEAEEKAKVKRQEREKFRNLSRDEQLKAEKKAQDKKQRKAQKKMKVRG
ncbi:hypothetical protein CXQ85_002162 [Candidozyma haemuli]|uniref:DUF1682-domain-containing protein n=1 Tax=Candidozyma haemuli TaxID=45357 RepID=A0A2V1ARG3_9ASCO|nr:hypothetical protein CXQ85_002162 [[Candida] haemuloni]PVH20375.1 hypothetical protein CXQ85_002162 [[Candida] haemuloni]